MALGLQGGYGAGGAADALKELLARKFMEQVQRQRVAQEQAELAQRQAEAQMRQQIAERQIGVDESRLGENRRQFDVTSGFKGRELGLEEQLQPLRLRHLGAQTSEIERKPLAEQADREHDLAVIREREASQLRMLPEETRAAISITQARAVNSAAARPRLQLRAGVSTGAFGFPAGTPVTQRIDIDTGQVLGEFPRGLSPEEQVQHAGAVTGARVGAGIDVRREKAPPTSIQQIGSFLKSLKGSGPVTITAPNGKTYTFKSQAEADAFKKAAGIQ